MMWKAIETKNGDVSIWRVAKTHENGELEYCGATFGTRIVAQDAAEQMNQREQSGEQIDEC